MLGVFGASDFDDHELVVFGSDPDVGLNAIVAIHDTTLGPALGGCRMWPYASEDEALTDVLRLARAMTYKNAAAGLDLGGGKALVWAGPGRGKSDALLRSLGRFVEGLGGRYITTEDMGVTPEDMVAVREETSHVVGLPRGRGGSGGAGGRGGSGGGGGAGRAGRPSRRGSRVGLADPAGRVFKAWGRRLAPLAMRPASRRGAILAQGLENTVPPVINTRTGS